MTLQVFPKSISSPEEAASVSRRAPPDGPTSAPYGADRRPVKASAPPVAVADVTIQGTCGPTCVALLPLVDRLSSWESRLLERLAMLGSTKSTTICEMKATPCRLPILQLQPSTRPISGNGSIGSVRPKFWRTPKASTGGHPPIGTTLNGARAKSDPNKKRATVSLSFQALHYPNRSGEVVSCVEAQMANSDALNPEFASWLQGYPDAWTQILLSETRSASRLRSKSSRLTSKASRKSRS